MEKQIVSKYENYLIIDRPHNKGNKCLLIFSSNGLDDSDDRNKYEFMNICSSRRIIKFFKRIIFVKDSYFHFYIDGINNNVNCISKLIILLNDLTQGYSVYTAGYSSGGYMALVCGIYMDNVDRVVSLGGIINVLDWHGSYCNYNFADCDAVKKASNDQRQYFDLSNRLNCLRAHSYFVYAGGAKSDQPMINSVKRIKNNKTHVLIFNTSKHGHYNWSYDYKYLFTFSHNKLDKIFDKYKNIIVSRKMFSISLQNPFRYVFNSYLRVFHKIKNVLHIENLV